jgi:hypothetical protein
LVKVCTAAESEVGNGCANGYLAHANPQHCNFAASASWASGWLHAAGHNAHHLVKQWHHPQVCWLAAAPASKQAASHSLSLPTLVTSLPVTLRLLQPRYKPTKQQQLFNFSLEKPFRTGSGWLAWGLLGGAAAPIVVGSMALLLTAVGYESATAGGHGTVDGVAGMISMDTPTYVRLLMVTGERKAAAKHRAYVAMCVHNSSAGLLG